MGYSTQRQLKQHHFWDQLIQQSMTQGIRLFTFFRCRHEELKIVDSKTVSDYGNHQSFNPSTTCHKLLLKWHIINLDQDCSLQLANFATAGKYASAIVRPGDTSTKIVNNFKTSIHSEQLGFPIACHHNSDPVTTISDIRFYSCYESSTN